MGRLLRVGRKAAPVAVAAMALAQLAPGAVPQAGALPSSPPTCTPASAPSIVGASGTTASVTVPSCSGNPAGVAYRAQLVAAGTTTVGAFIDVPKDVPQRTITLTPGTVYKARIASRNWAGLGPVSSDSAAFAAPFTSLTAFTDRQYQDFTGALPTTTERNAWNADLAAATKTPVEQISSAVDFTYWQKQSPVIRLYQAYFLRIPDLSGLNFWTNRYRNGTWTLSAISQSFATSSEFINRYGSLTNQQFVEQVYLNVLDRAGDPSGITYWTNQLNSGNRNRGQVMLEFSESNENKTDEARFVDVVNVFTGMLRRVPTTAEMTTWEPSTRAAHVLSLLGGAEYTTRVGTTPPALPTLGYDALFTRWDQPFGWIGGDGGRTTLLPDGRVLWGFGDSSAGLLTGNWPTETGDLRNRDWKWINNSFVTTRPGTNDFTSYYRTNSSTGIPESYIDPSTTLPTGHVYWTAAQTVEPTTAGDKVQVFLMDIKVSGTVPSSGRRIATLNASTLAVESIGSALPQGSYTWDDPNPGEPDQTAPVLWGNALLTDGGYTYIYGEWQRPNWGFDKRTFVARAPVGSLTDPNTWTYWSTGNTWSSSSNQLVQVSDRSLNTVIKTANGYVTADIDTFNGNATLSKQLRTYRASAPTGPWTIDTATPTTTYQIPEDAGLGLTAPYKTYLPQLHPYITNPANSGQILASWSNDYDTDWAGLNLKYGYRPRFTWVTVSQL